MFLQTYDLQPSLF